MRFSGKTVVVTGAASGIGAAATALFAGEGAGVFASDIDVAGGQQLAADSEGDVRFVECDVCDPAAIKALMAHESQAVARNAADRIQEQRKRLAEGHDMEYAETFKQFNLRVPDRT